MISLKPFRLVVFILIPSLLWAADPLFEPKMDYPKGGTGGYSVFGADLDGDGDVDLAVGGFGDISVLKNNGDGTFSAPVSYSSAGLSYKIFGADLDGDSDIDLATANLAADYVSISKNNGDGSFQAPVSFSLQPTGEYPMTVFGADLDGDGDVDLATANRDSDNISVLMNNGDRTFQPAVSYSGGFGNRYFSITSADLDGDLDMDLAAGTRDCGAVSIFKNNGDGSFQPVVHYGAGCNPFSVFALDLDWDGDLDLATANYYDTNVSVLMNNGDGTYAVAVNYPAGAGSQTIYGADLDVDGDKDLAVANFLNDNISILMNNGDGSFQTAVNYEAGSSPFSVFAADIDADGDPDLAVANVGGEGTVSIFMNLTVIICMSKPGDANGSGGFPNLTDLIYLINYVFKSGPAPVPIGRCCL